MPGFFEQVIQTRILPPPRRSTLVVYENTSNHLSSPTNSNETPSTQKLAPIVNMDNCNNNKRRRDDPISYQSKCIKCGCPSNSRRQNGLYSICGPIYDTPVNHKYNKACPNNVVNTVLMADHNKENPEKEQEPTETREKPYNYYSRMDRNGNLMYTVYI